jgi:hypothetical protein
VSGETPVTLPDSDNRFSLCDWGLSGSVPIWDSSPALLEMPPFTVASSMSAGFLYLCEVEGEVAEAHAVPAIESALWKAPGRFGRAFASTPGCLAQNKNRGREEKQERVEPPHALF